MEKPMRSSHDYFPDFNILYGQKENHVTPITNDTNHEVHSHTSESGESHKSHKSHKFSEATEMDCGNELEATEMDCGNEASEYKELLQEPMDLDLDLNSVLDLDWSFDAEDVFPDFIMPNETKAEVHELKYTPKCCISSHRLAQEDPSNFGRLYNNYNLRTPSRIFPSICGSCLLSKFSLMEDASKKTRNLFCHGRRDFYSKREGPFLRAYQITRNVFEGNLVFPSDTLILPVGQLLLDTLMIHPDHLFSRDNESIQYRTNTKTYRLNPYLFVYFRNLHFRGTGIRSRKIKKEIEIENDLLFASVSLAVGDGFLTVAYQNDSLLFGNLLEPTAESSAYVREGKKILLDSGNVVKIDIGQDELKISNQRDSLFDNGQIRLLSDQFSKVTKVNQGSRLEGTFFEKHNKKNYKVPKTTTGRYVASMCLPQDIFNETSKLIGLCPNVRYVDCLGLVSTRPIYSGQYLVIDLGLKLQHYVHLKTNVLDHPITYLSIPK